MARAAVSCPLCGSSDAPHLFTARDRNRRVSREPFDAEGALHRTVLPNGLTVLSEHMPGVRSIAFGAWVRAASVHEPRDRMGVSHLLEHMVFKGTRTRTAKEIALYDAGVYTNVAIHPAVPPAGALLRTSVMATHDDATLTRALDAFAEVKRGFEKEHGPLPGPSA